MKSCPACAQQNPDEARFCLQCGNSIAQASTPEASPSLVDEERLWAMFIGSSRSIQFSLKEGWSWRPASVYYLQKFQRFQTPSGPRFALTWHWPAALFDPFLWFLYRKMYMFALVYAVGPVLSALLTGDVSVGIVWRIFAGASANYIYFWHIKDSLNRIRAKAGGDQRALEQLIKEEGGVQPYVIWLGVALHLLMLGVIIAAIEQGPPPELERSEMEEGVSGFREF